LFPLLVNREFTAARKGPVKVLGDPSRNTPWAFLIPQMTALYRAVALGAFARGIVEEGAAGYGVTADAIQGGGVTTGRTGHPPGIYYPISIL
jgi:hypothetical protein